MQVPDAEVLPGTPLVIVAGKGGVGRSSVAMALAAAYARDGSRVALVHPADAPAAVPDGPVAAGLSVRPLDGAEALHTYLGAQLPGPFAAALRASRAFGLITAATPGLSELLTIGELQRLLDIGYERVVFDAPTTGHLLAMFDAPRRFERAAAVGPIAARARHLGDWISDPGFVSCVAVTTGDGLAVSEFLDLIGTLEERAGHRPAMTVANRLAPPSPTPAELQTLAARPGRRPGDAAVLDAIDRLATRARSERAQLGRVTRAVGAAPVRVVEQPGRAVAAIAQALEEAGR